MLLQQLNIEHFRIIEQADFKLSPCINLFIGENASGKSSLIEAVHLLSTGRSFRPHRTQDLISHQKSHVLVTAKLLDDKAFSYPIGIHKTLSETRIRVNHADAKQADLSRHIPLSVIHPDTIQLVLGGPSQRRALLDSVAFYRHSEFHNLWKQYQRVTQQRNICLKDEKQRYALKYWTEQWVILQANLARMRQFAVQYLQDALTLQQPITEPLGTLRLQLTNGFPQYVNVFETEAVLAFLKQRQGQEIEQGFSLYGAHRSDLSITLNNYPAPKVASRGQLKLLGVALLLARSFALADEPQARGIIAVDDLTSELDNDNQQLLLQRLLSTQQQLILTGIQPPKLDPALDCAMFHVEQGRFRSQHK